ncbi:MULTISPECIES: hypothetical protein [unclassified Streptomyces]|uniref:hypothetical protein n=1 Tax=unclassified Streptomyces TaxID=2593676 RepID=UPI002DDA014C|nr:hypothetical protein [Streptomyces sp. NBC_01237]WRZ70354.1 hypothetical protein OG251_01270 [Streptomyces sp. NBC_01237]
MRTRTSASLMAAGLFATLAACGGEEVEAGPTRPGGRTSGIAKRISQAPHHHLCPNF